MNTKELTVLMVEPGKHLRVTKIKDDLDSLQQAVSIGADYQGLIEFVSLGNGDYLHGAVHRLHLFKTIQVPENISKKDEDNESAETEKA